MSDEMNKDEMDMEVTPGPKPEEDEAVTEEAAAEVPAEETVADEAAE